MSRTALLLLPAAVLAGVALGYAFKAIERFDAALFIDERHFDARLARAVSLHHFPTFLNGWASPSRTSRSS